MTDNTHASFWPRGWWKIVDHKIGIIPVPIYVVLLAQIAGFVVSGKVPSDILFNINTTTMWSLRE